jgi:hypothetical protein
MAFFLVRLWYNMPMISSKQILKVGGTLLFLFGVFGYIYPKWGNVQFSNNENLFHVITGLLAVLMAEFSVQKQRIAMLVLVLIYLALGIYGFYLKQPTDFHIKNVTAQLDLFDNISHTLIGLAWAWFWLRTKSK